MGSVHLIYIFFIKPCLVLKIYLASLLRVSSPLTGQIIDTCPFPLCICDLCSHRLPSWGTHQTSSIHLWHSPFTYTWLHSLPFGTITSSQTSLNILTSSRLLTLKPIQARSISSLMGMLKVWSLNHLNQTHLETCYRCKLLCPPQAWEPEILGCGPQVCLFRSPGDSERQFSQARVSSFPVLINLIRTHVL